MSSNKCTLRRQRHHRRQQELKRRLKRNKWLLRMSQTLTSPTCWILEASYKRLTRSKLQDQTAQARRRRARDSSGRQQLCKERERRSGSLALQCPGPSFGEYIIRSQSISVEQPFEEARCRGQLEILIHSSLLCIYVSCSDTSRKAVAVFSQSPKIAAQDVPNPRYTHPPHHNLALRKLETSRLSGIGPADSPPPPFPSGLQAQRHLYCS